MDKKNESKVVQARLNNKGSSTRKAITTPTKLNQVHSAPVTPVSVNVKEVMQTTEGSSSTNSAVEARPRSRISHLADKIFAEFGVEPTIRKKRHISTSAKSGSRGRSRGRGRGGTPGRPPGAGRGGRGAGGTTPVKQTTIQEKKKKPVPTVYADGKTLGKTDEDIIQSLDEQYYTKDFDSFTFPLLFFDATKTSNREIYKQYHWYKRAFIILSTVLHTKIQVHKTALIEGIGIVGELLRQIYDTKTLITNCHKKLKEYQSGQLRKQLGIVNTVRCARNYESLYKTLFIVKQISTLEKQYSLALGNYNFSLAQEIIENGQGKVTQIKDQFLCVAKFYEKFQSGSEKLKSKLRQALREQTTLFNAWKFNQVLSAYQRLNEDLGERFTSNQRLLL